MKYYRLKDIAPHIRTISDRDHKILIHVMNNLAYASEDFGISRTAVAKIFYKHLKRFSLCYKELDYDAQLALSAKHTNPLKPLEFVANHRQLIKKAIKAFYY